MSASLRELMQKAFAHQKQLHTTITDAPFVDGITLSLRSGGQSEIVAFQYRGQDVAHSCTCGEADCKHVFLALRWVLDQELRKPSQPDIQVEITREKSGLTGAFRTIPSPERPPIEDAHGFAMRLGELATTAVRAGTRAVDSPSVTDTFTQLIGAAPKPPPLGFERWLGRLRLAMESGDSGALATQLFASAQISRDLDARGSDSRARLAAWFGTRGFDSSVTERLQDRVLIEVAREWLSGSRRAALERRYLIDTLSGEVFREERLRDGEGASAGPCPRIVHVGLAHVYPGVPRRVRLLQYVISGKVGFNDWNRINTRATTQFDELLPYYRNAIKTFAGLAEPFVWVRPVRIEKQPGGICLIDEAGLPLPLAHAENPAEAELVTETSPAEHTQWVAGRLMDVQGHLLLRPRSVMRLIGKELKLTRIS